MPERVIKHGRSLFLTLRNHNMPFVVYNLNAEVGFFSLQMVADLTVEVSVVTVKFFSLIT